MQRSGIQVSLQGADDVACLNEMSIFTRRVSFLGLASSAKSERKKHAEAKKSNIQFHFLYAYKNLQAYVL